MSQVSNIYFWISIAGLAFVAFFVPSPLNLLLFIGALFAMMWEVSDRLRVQYVINKQNGEYLERIVELLERIEDSSENTASYLYENTEEYRRHVGELDEP